jgi:hypothetical protein
MPFAIAQVLFGLGAVSRGVSFLFYPFCFCSGGVIYAMPVINHVTTRFDPVDTEPSHTLVQEPSVAPVPL